MAFYRVFERGEVWQRLVEAAEAEGFGADAAVGSRESMDAFARFAAGAFVATASFARGDGFIPIVADQRGPADRPAPYRQASLALRAVAPVARDIELQANLGAFDDRRTRGTAFSAIRSDGADAALFQLETSIPAAFEFARQAEAREVRVIFNPAPALPVPDDLLALADVIVPNEIEAMTLTGIVPDNMGRAYEAADLLQRKGEADIVLTQGSQGALAMTDRGRLDVAAFRVPVVDTVGAGDAFVAALTVALGEGLPLQDAMRFAAAAGALSVTRPGAEPSMPRRHEVEALLANGRLLTRSLA